RCRPQSIPEERRRGRVTQQREGGQVAAGRQPESEREATGGLAFTPSRPCRAPLVGFRAMLAGGSTAVGNLPDIAEDLQERGVYRTDYAGSLRENLELAERSDKVTW